MKGITFARVLAFTAWVGLVGCLSAAGGTLFTNPFIHVTPGAIDFGAVPLKQSATNTFLVENWGGGKLVGKATVPSPFKIISGGTYRLGPNDAQVVTVSYTPTGALLDTNAVTFTGGAGLSAGVCGRSAGPPPNLPLAK